MERIDAFIVAIITSAVVLGTAFSNLLAFFPYALAYVFVFYLGRDEYSHLIGPEGWRDRAIPIIILVGSFAITPLKWIFVPGTSVFGVINFTFFLIGLTYMFYRLDRANLKALWKPHAIILFMAFMNAAVNLYISAFMEDRFGPVIASWAASTATSMGYDGVRSIHNIIYVKDVPIQISGGCTGILGIVLYSTISAAILIHLKLRPMTKLLVVLVGIYGVLSMNLLRVLIIVIVAHQSPGSLEAVHEWLGNILFTLFLLLYWYAVLALYDRWNAKKDNFHAVSKP